MLRTKGRFLLHWIIGSLFPAVRYVFFYVFLLNRSMYTRLKIKIPFRFDMICCYMYVKCFFFAFFGIVYMRVGRRKKRRKDLNMVYEIYICILPRIDRCLLLYSYAVRYLFFFSFLFSKLYSCYFFFIFSIFFHFFFSFFSFFFFIFSFFLLLIALLDTFGCYMIYHNERFVPFQGMSYHSVPFRSIA